MCLFKMDLFNWFKNLHLKKTFIVIAAISIFAPSLSHSLTKSYHREPLHLDLEMTGAEYQTLMDHQKGFNLFEDNSNKFNFEDIFTAGKRNLDWIRVINKNRALPISLSTPETQLGYPIDSPRIYNPNIIRNSFNEIQQTIPEELKLIIFGQGELPAELPVADDVYILWGLKIDRVYQIAARWKMMVPFLDYLKANSHKDIRGYYFLTTTPGFPDKLKNWKELSSEDQKKATLWLRQVCNNDLRNKQQCLKQTEKAIQTNLAFDFFNSHKLASQTILNDMLNIYPTNKFNKITWQNHNQLKIPFVTPDNESMKLFLTDNIESEWKLLPFSLHIDFVSPQSYGVEVIWKPGITPHVPRLGDNTIFMDANAPISEYDVKWTIRHEFGHVLGFPDCYLEFFDTELEAIVSYQFDTSDLMCSRRGHLKSRHIDEIKKIYTFL